MSDQTIDLSDGPLGYEKVRRAVGSLMMIGWEGTELDEPTELIKKLRPSGLIFFSRNYPPEGAERLSRTLWAIKERGREILGRELFERMSFSFSKVSFPCGSRNTQKVVSQKVSTQRSRDAKKFRHFFFIRTRN
jgi:hypothetical protein